MRPSEKSEAKDAQISPYRHAETSKACPELAIALPALRSFSKGGSEVEGVVEWAEAKRKSSTYSVSAGKNSMLKLSTRVGNECHSEPRPIQTVLAK